MPDWADVKTGDVVQSARDGMAYQVISRDGLNVTIKGQDGKIQTVRPTGSVVRLLSAEAVRKHAAALVETHLGGEVIALREKGSEIHLVPVEFDSPGALWSHLYIFHGVIPIEGDEANLPTLVARHAQYHGPEAKESGWTPHQHTPDFLEKTRR
jgi:hypothetical protein